MRAPDPGQNLFVMFERRAQARAQVPFLWEKRAGAWQSRSWSQVLDSVHRLADSLIRHGIEPGDRVALIAENSPDWFIADHAIMAAGAITVPSYTTHMADDFRYLLEHSQAKAVIGGGAAISKRLRPALTGNELLRLVIDTGELGDGLDHAAPRLTLAQALAEAPADPDRLPGRDRKVEDTACFIYTSGTGGRPKGVMLSHANILANIHGAWNLLNEVTISDDVFLSFLPLSHAYEHTAGQFLPVAMEAQIYYSEGVDKLSSNLIEARPTIVTCVPRLFEVLRHRIQSGVDRQGGMKAKLFHKALDIGGRRAAGEPVGLVDRLIDPVLDRLVRRKIAERFGGRLKAMVSGGAPLSDEVGRFFLGLGVPLLQGYGQTEASPVISVNRPKRNRLGTVGPVMSGVEMTLAEDGEILLRGPTIMQGYWREPEATALALREGWLHTGDIGVVEPDGYLRITDRKKDIIVNTGGDNIAPQRVEGILTLQPEIAQALIYGDRRPHLVALLSPAKELLQSGSDVAQAIEAAVKRANLKLSMIERVRRYLIVPEGFSVENGLMTPTLKLRRGQIIERFKDNLDSMYVQSK